MKLTKTLIKTDRYFPDDRESRDIYRITITNNGTRISFRYGDSLKNTGSGTTPTDDDILSCVKMDYHNTAEQYPTFADFCDELGYDNDSISSEKIYKNCLKQAEKLHKVFTDEEIENMPD